MALLLEGKIHHLSDDLWIGAAITAFNVQCAVV